MLNADYGNDGNEWTYRLSASQAFAIAVGLVTGAYDESITNVPKEEAKDMAIKLSTSVAYSNIANGGNYKSWGDDWQANLWAYFAGIAGWYLWDELDQEQQELIYKMVEYQANRFINQNPPYWVSEDGLVMYPGDSKIEENAWNGELLYLAYTMMPDHENAQKWYNKFLDFQLSAFATPSMNDSDEIIHGREAKYWVDGYNINDDGTVINHNLVHPTYNASTDGVNLSIVASPIKQSLPLAAKYNLDVLYSAFTKVEFELGEIYPGTNEPVQGPGGSIYRPYSDSKNYVEDGADSIIYYPLGSDWGKAIFDVFANIDVSAHVYGYGDFDDTYEYAKYHTQQVIYQQERNEDGSTYISDEENNYLGREEAISSRIGLAYMTYWLSRYVEPDFHNDDAKLESIFE